MIGWGVKIWPQGGGQLHETRRGREGELSKKNKENVNFGQKLGNFLRVRKKTQKISGKYRKLQLVGVREGVK